MILIANISKIEESSFSELISKIKGSLSSFSKDFNLLNPEDDSEILFGVVQDSQRFKLKHFSQNTESTSNPIDDLYQSKLDDFIVIKISSGKFYLLWNSANEDGECEIKDGEVSTIYYKKRDPNSKITQSDMIQAKSQIESQLRKRNAA